MALIGYQASHEQFTPSDLLTYAVMAEQAGFQFINSSDHFYPWGKNQGQSGFSFAWLGAAMNVTTVPYSLVVSPGPRYHPAIVAQAAATLQQMFPGRFAMALGSGEYLNERITGAEWPIKSERNEQLKEAYSIIKRLLDGETVTHNGRIKADSVKLYTLPETPPKMVVAAVTKETVAWAAGWADGVVTIHKPYDELKEVVETFRANGGKDKPLFLKVQLSFAATEEEALLGAHDQWKTNIINSKLLQDLFTVEHFDAAASYIKPEDMRSMVRISSDIQQHIEWIQQDLELGFDRIILHNVNREQTYFINEFGDKVLSRF